VIRLLPAASAGQRGFALLIVLWTLALLALIGSHITAAAHGMLTRGASMRAAAEVSAAADGLVEQAIFGLLDPSSRHWPADGVVRPVRVAGGTGVVVIEDDAGRINPGAASPGLMTALMRRVGVDQTDAQRVAASLSEWHSAGSPGGPGASPYRAAGLPWGPANERFYTNDEMALVLGMTPDILKRLAPYVSVHTDGRVDIAKASPLVARVLQDAGADRPPAVDDHALLVVDITASVTKPGARAVRHAVVRIDPNDDDAIRPYRILAWD
jgi:general secretion pathway protein K